MRCSGLIAAFDTQRYRIVVDEKDGLLGDEHQAPLRVRRKAAPPSGDDDGNLALTAPDLSIDADERDAVAFTVSGLDADATAVVTVTATAMPISVQGDVRRCRGGSGCAGDRESFACILLEPVARSAALVYPDGKAAAAIGAANG